MTNLLTHLEQPGAIAILPHHATFAERHSLALHLAALRTAGHAITADELMEYGESTGSLRIVHYKSCNHPSCRKS
jgi:hypothetical protein